MTNNNRPHFDISAAVVRQLGEELVTDEVTAIMELVKNAYDACATWVRIEVGTTSLPVSEEYHFKNGYGYIIIEDNGFGMTDADITKGWMVISLSMKRKMKELGETTPCGRTPLGDKGLGRLSTQRLGQRLEMFTIKDGESEGHHVAFDWADFKEDTALSEVPMYYKSIPKSTQQKGTRLVLTNLKQVSSWRGQSADRFKGQLSQLIFPFKDKRPFNTFLKIDNIPVDLDEINEVLRNQAVSRFKFNFDGESLTIQGTIKQSKLYTGSVSSPDGAEYQKLVVDDKGKSFFSFLTDVKRNRSHFLDGLRYEGKDGMLFSFKIVVAIENIPGKATVFADEQAAKYDTKVSSKISRDQAQLDFSGESDLRIFANPGPFFGEIDDFNLRENEALSAAFDKFSQYKELVANQVGVRIFRDGFGIKPFGIDGEDWLKLGSSQTKGASFYGLRPFNTIGYVSLTADGNKNLREKTDREGFMETPYSKNFFLLMEKVVDTINSHLQKTRRSYNDFRAEYAQKEGKITSTKESFERLQNTSGKAKSIQDESHQLSPALSKIANSVRLAIQKVESTKPRTAEDNEQRELMKEIDTSLHKAIDVLSKVDTILDTAKTLEHDANYLKPRIEDLENQLGEFAELAGLGLTAEALSHEISNIVDRLLEQTNNISKKVKGKQTIDTSSVYVYVEYVKSSIQAFRKQLSHLTPSLRYVRESKQEFSLQSYFKEITEFYDEKYRGSIKITLNSGKEDFKIKMSRGKLTQIVDNIILNSEFWLKERQSKDKKFRPEIVITLEKPTIKISDNGQGIDPLVEQRIFQPFVTSKPRNVGRGLGLFIVQQLLDTVDGRISLSEKTNPENRKYIFQIDLSSIVI